MKLISNYFDNGLICLSNKSKFSDFSLLKVNIVCRFYSFMTAN